MLKVFVLVVISHVNSGVTVSFQEFNSVEQCNHVAKWMASKSYIRSVACFAK